MILFFQYINNLNVHVCIIYQAAIKYMQAYVCMFRIMAINSLSVLVTTLLSCCSVSGDTISPSDRLTGLSWTRGWRCSCICCSSEEERTSELLLGASWWAQSSAVHVMFCRETWSKEGNRNQNTIPNMYIKTAALRYFLIYRAPFYVYLHNVDVIYHQ